MSNASKGTQGRRHYLSYLLRLWRPNADRTVWRASLENSRGGEPIGFASLEALFAFLREQTDKSETTHDELLN